MTEVARGDGGSVYLSIGYNHHDLVLCPARQKALINVAPPRKPHIAIGDLTRGACELLAFLIVKTDSQPGVAELVIPAPGRQRHTVLRCDRSPAPGFSSGKPAHRRCASATWRSSPSEGDKLVTFFRDLLGFWLNDDIGRLRTSSPAIGTTTSSTSSRPESSRDPPYRLRTPGQSPQHAIAADTRAPRG